jgi:hypothetical protein
MRGVFLFYVLLLNSLLTTAQTYSVSAIPDSLKKNANYVKQYEELIVEVVSFSKVRYFRKYVYTILNPKASVFGKLSQYYGSFSAIESISGELYDALGNKLKTVKKKDIADVSWGDGVSFVSDIRYKEHDFGHREYPYTVSYEIETITDGLLFLPEWIPQKSGGVSVMESVLKVVYPLRNPVRYKQQFLPAPDSSITRSGDISLSWTAKNIPAQKEEPYQPSWYKVLPRVQLAPSIISAEGYMGNISTWKDYGLFIYQLTRGRDVLPAAVAAKVHEISDPLNGREQKVKALYRYLQENTRYISIQLGIGGWQPYDANFVATNKYGDCKALSNYMVALLKEAGIKSHYVEIEAGEDAEPLQEDFPCSQANHVIVCVPNDKDSIWLECTSPYTPAGYNGRFTGNRKAILIREDGAHIVKTSHYTSKDNLVQRKVMATVDATGKLVANIHTKLTGQEQEPLFGVLHYNTEQQKLDYLNKDFRIPSYKVEKHEHKVVPNRIPVIEQKLELVAENFAVINGKRLFITPNQFNQMGERYTLEEPRKYPIEYQYSFLHYDTISIEIPPGYLVESMAKDINITNKFGHYSICYTLTNNTILVLREYERYSIVAPAEDWPAYSKFMEEIYKGDRARITMVKASY